MIAFQQENLGHPATRWLLGGLALSLGVSKAGLSAFSVLILLFFLYTAYHQRSQLSLNGASPLTKGLLLLYAVGIFTSLASYGGLASTKDFLNKGVIFLILPISLVWLREGVNRDYALRGLLLGAVIGTLYSVYLWTDVVLAGSVTGRIASFWDIGRWGEYLCYILAFLLPQLFAAPQDRPKATMAVVYALALFALLISGSRGPLLALIVAALVYFLLLDRRYLLQFVLTVSAGMVVLLVAAPAVLEFAWMQLLSIFDVSKNLSNLARIHMWRHALDFFQYNLENDWRSVLFGSGFENLGMTFKAYLARTEQLESLMVVTGGEASVNDHHSALLNVLNRMGLVYLLVLGYVFWLLIKSLRRRLQDPRYRRDAWLSSAILIVASYLVIGIFYSNELNYQTLMAAFMCSLAVRYSDAAAMETETSHHV